MFLSSFLFKAVLGLAAMEPLLTPLLGKTIVSEFIHGFYASIKAAMELLSVAILPQFLCRFIVAQKTELRKGSTKGSTSEGRRRRHKTFLLRFYQVWKHFAPFKRPLSVTHAVYICVLYRKIGTPQGANHNAPFQLRTVQLYNKYNTLIVHESGLQVCLLYLKHANDLTSRVSPWFSIDRF